MNGYLEALIAAAETAHEIPFSIRMDQPHFHLCKVEFEVFVGAAAKFKASGPVSFDLTRAHTLLFIAEILEWDESAQKVMKTDEILTFKCDAFKAEGRISDFESNGHYEFRIFDLHYLKPFFCTSIFFLVPNSRLQGTDYIKNDLFAYTGRLTDSFETYEILIDKLSDKDRKGDQEYISHIVEFRKSKPSFGAKEIDDIARKLQALFSFIDGHWLAPVLAYYYENGEPEMVWLNPGKRWTPPEKLRNWYFDALRTTDPKIISKSFAFMSQDYNLSLWQQCLTWYFEALEGDLKKAILANHIGLEMLSWAIVVEMKAQASENKFNKLSAAEKIDQLIAIVGISNAIPTELVELNRYAATEGIQSGPKLLSQIRNSVVHPKKKHRDQLAALDMAIYEDAQRLGIWYLESCLLFLIKYEGRMFKPFGSKPINSPINCVPVNFNQP